MTAAVDFVVVMIAINFFERYFTALWLPSPAHSNLQLDFKVVLLLAHSSDHIFELPNQLKNNTREKLSTKIHMI